MADKKAPGGDKPKVKSKKNDVTNKKINSASESENEVSFDIHTKSIDDVKAIFDNKLKLMEAQFNAKCDALTKVIETKDKVIAKLNQKMGEMSCEIKNLKDNQSITSAEIKDLKNTCDYLTDETKQLDGQIKVNKVAIEGASKKHDTLFDKTIDLEDRSRRNNVVFFNIPETTQSTDNENCEQKIVDILCSHGFIRQDYDIQIDRAHRLGRRQEDSKSKPRPIIVRFHYYKDKDFIVKNGRKLKDSAINLSEDFSKHTLDIHRELRKKTKLAQEALNNDETQEKSITHFKVTYRRVVVNYSSDKKNSSAPTFTRSFSLNYMLDNSKWYLPPGRNTYAQVTKVKN